MMEDAAIYPTHAWIVGLVLADVQASEFGSGEADLNEAGQAVEPIADSLPRDETRDETR
jgi:hypothetical protein